MVNGLSIKKHSVQYMKRSNHIFAKEGLKFLVLNVTGHFKRLIWSMFAKRAD